jgi:hypothetical protein
MVKAIKASYSLTEQCSELENYQNCVGKMENLKHVDSTREKINSVHQLCANKNIIYDILIIYIFYHCLNFSCGCFLPDGNFHVRSNS